MSASNGMWIFIDFETKTPIFLDEDEKEQYKLREDGLVTTIGQLAFFRWAILNEVVDFCFNNKDKIVQEMEIMDKKKNKPKKIKEIKEKTTTPVKTDKLPDENLVKVIIKFP